MWYFEGTGQQVRVSLNEAGLWFAYGPSSQKSNFGGGDPAIYNHISGIGGFWRISSANAAEADYDGLGLGLKKQYARNNGKPTGMITYFTSHEDNSPFISASIVLPPQQHEEVMAAFRSILGNPNVKFMISLNVLGFRLPEIAPNEFPSVAEFTEPDFMKRRAYLSDRVHISFIAVECKISGKNNPTY